MLMQLESKSNWIHIPVVVFAKATLWRCLLDIRITYLTSGEDKIPLDSSSANYVHFKFHWYFSYFLHIMTNRTINLLLQFRSIHLQKMIGKRILFFQRNSIIIVTTHKNILKSRYNSNNYIFLLVHTTLVNFSKNSNLICYLEAVL